MRIAIASNYGCGVSWWRRLLDEGHEVVVWIGDPKGGPMISHRKVGVGIVPRVDGWGPLLEWAKEGVRSGQPTIILFDSSALGEQADEARKSGIYVIGGGRFCDRLEEEREFGMNIAQSAGMQIPGRIEFASLDETIAFAQSGRLDRPVYFKTDSYISDDATHSCDDAQQLIEYLEGLKNQTRPNIKNILQEKIEGVAVSTERWWNGRSWVGPYIGIIEHKKFMSGDIGPSVGCSFNAVWFYPEVKPMTAISLNWDRLTELFLKHEAPPGLYDANAILCNGETHFLEWCARLGYDSEPASQLLIKDLGKWLWWVATAQGEQPEIREEIALSIHLSVPPYPSEIGRDQKGSPVGLRIDGEVGNLYSDGFIAYEVGVKDGVLTLAAPSGSVGLSAAIGDSLEELGEQTLDFAKKKLRVAGLMFRNDAAEMIRKDAETAREEGFTDFPEGLYY